MTRDQAREAARELLEIMPLVMRTVTSAGRAALERVGRCAEGHLAEVLAPLDAASRRRLQGGLGVPKKVFTAPPESAGRRRRGPTGRG